MSRIVLNKQKIKTNIILKRFFIVFILLFILIFLYWWIISNYKLSFVSNYIESFSKRYDFLFTEVEIIGLNNVSEVEINQYFEKFLNQSIFLVPLKQISYEIEKNSWIKSAILKNDFKNRISIYIIEIMPIAVYFNGENYLLINKSGKAIEFATDIDIQKYIIVEGEFASKHAYNLIESIPKELKSRIVRVQYINNRRWDIYTKENLRVRLPETEYKKAMNIFIDIYDDIYSSDISNIKYIDLRMPEKAIIKFSNENI